MVFILIFVFFWQVCPTKRGPGPAPAVCFFCLPPCSWFWAFRVYVFFSLPLPFSHINIFNKLIKSYCVWEVRLSSSSLVHELVRPSRGSQSVYFLGVTPQVALSDIPNFCTLTPPVGHTGKALKPDLLSTCMFARVCTFYISAKQT